MEWFGFQDSSFGESLLGCLTPQSDNDQQQAAAADWTFEENKLFEDALAEFEPGSPAFFENVASRVPWKAIEEIKKHYKALIEDVEMIENGRFPIPDYESWDDDQQPQEEQVVLEKKKGNASSPSLVKKNTGHQRRRGIPWTEEEHQLFLMGLNKYGKGDWRSISRYYVITKTPTQVASHAQKYFRRQTSTTPPDRRRPSIHDIQTVNPTTFFAMPPQGSNSSRNQELLPFPHPYGLNPPMFNNNYYNNGFGEQFGDFSNDQSSMNITPMSSTFPVEDTNPMMMMMMMNQQLPSDACNNSMSSSSYMMPPSFGNNNQWG